MSEFAEMAEHEGHLRVGACEVHARLNTIVRGGITYRCEPRVIDVLLCLVRHAPEPVSKEQLQAEVWPDATVSKRPPAALFARQRSSPDGNAKRSGRRPSTARFSAWSGRYPCLHGIRPNGRSPRLGSRWPERS